MIMSIAHRTDRISPLVTLTSNESRPEVLQNSSVCLHLSPNVLEAILVKYVHALVYVSYYSTHGNYISSSLIACPCECLS